MTLRKVRVTMPKAQSGLEIKMRAGLGFNANQLSWPVMAGEFSEPDIEERRTLGPVDEDEANLEAEVGETAVTDLNGDGIPENYNIGGKRHYDGGTPLNLPDNSFIFSRDKSMKIKDKKILEQFGITSSPIGGVTPADISKKFNINKYKKVLLDKNSDELSRKTAELMISNYNLKLGMLALVQESMKGFPGGIPYIAAPYLESIGLDAQELLSKSLSSQGEEDQPEEDMPAQKYGGNQTQNLEKYQGTTGKSQTNEFKRNSWNIRKIPAYNKYMFLYVDANGQITKAQSNNPKPGDTRTAEEIMGVTNTASPSATSTQVKTAAARSGQPAPQKTNLIKPPLSGKDASTDYDPRLGDYNDAYYELVHKVNSDEKVKQSIYDNYLARIESNSSLTPKQKEILKGYSKDKVIESLLEYQKQNYAIRMYDRWNNGSLLTDKLWDRTNKDNSLKNVKYKQTARELNFKDDDLFVGADGDDTKTRVAQAAFAGLVDTANSDDFKDYFKDYQAVTGGPDQIKVYDKDHPLLSNIDGIYGNNTASAIFMAKNPGKSEEEKKLEETPDEGKPAELQHKELKNEFKYDQDTPFWLQDIIKAQGAFGDYARIKKYLPWQAVPSVDYMEPQFVSPERELASNAEQLAIGAQGLGQFTGPQSYNARFSQLAGKAAANAADILGRNNTVNVGIANEAEKFNVETFNRYAEARSANATNLFDKVTIANQNYDNSKNQARQTMRQSYIDAITNRAQTDVLNTLYPQYAVNPLTGGTAYFRNPMDVESTKPTDQINEIYKWMDRKPANIDSEDWFKIYYKQSTGDDLSTSESKKTKTVPNPGYGAYGQNTQ